MTYVSLAFCFHSFRGHSFVFPIASRTSGTPTTSCEYCTAVYQPSDVKVMEKLQYHSALNHIGDVCICILSLNSNRFSIWMHFGKSNLISFEDFPILSLTDLLSTLKWCISFMIKSFIFERECDWKICQHKKWLQHPHKLCQWTASLTQCCQLEVIKASKTVF